MVRSDSRRRRSKETKTCLTDVSMFLSIFFFLYTQKKKLYLRLGTNSSFQNMNRKCLKEKSGRMYKKSIPLKVNSPHTRDTLAGHRIRETQRFVE